MQLTTKAACLALSALLLAGCSTTFLSSIGPSRKEIEHSADTRALPPIQVIDVNEDVTQRLVAQRSRHLFSEVLSGRPDQLQPIGAGGFLVGSPWEAPPAPPLRRSRPHPLGLREPPPAAAL